MKKGREADARKSLHILHKDDADFSIDNEIVFLKATINEQEEINKSSTWADCFRGTNRVCPLLYIRNNNQYLTVYLTATNRAGDPHPGHAAAHRRLLHLQLRHRFLLTSRSRRPLRHHDHDEPSEPSGHGRLLLHGGPSRETPAPAAGLGHHVYRPHRSRYLRAKRRRQHRCAAQHRGVRAYLRLWVRGIMGASVSLHTTKQTPPLHTLLTVCIEPG